MITLIKNSQNEKIGIVALDKDILGHVFYPEVANNTITLCQLENIQKIIHESDLNLREEREKFKNTRFVLFNKETQAFFREDGSWGELASAKVYNYEEKGLKQPSLVFPLFFEQLPEIK